MDRETFELYRGAVADLLDLDIFETEDTEVERLLNALAVYGLVVGRG